MNQQGDRVDSPARELTPLERAQELAYDAMEANGRLRIKRARQALALSAECADAWVILAEEAPTPEAALECCERGVLAGAAAIGADRFDPFRGEFWEHLETRPYMRARLGLAQALRGLGRDDEAFSHYRALLELNPDDNQGVRYLLLVALLHRGMNDEAGALLSKYEDDPQALWWYGRLLWEFRVGGDKAGRGRYSTPRSASIHWWCRTCSIPIRLRSIARHTSRWEARRRPHTSRTRLLTYSRLQTGRLNGWQRHQWRQPSGRAHRRRRR